MAAGLPSPPDQAQPHLVWSKVQAPVRRSHVARPALVRLCRTPGTRLTLIRAPAGWGKSTLLADWASAPEETRAWAWVALDRQDNDPVRFWSYVIHSLRLRRPAAGRRSLELLEAPRADVVADVLPALFTELGGSDEELVLALDDYHLVTNPEIDTAMAYFVESVPPGVSVAVASRSQPPWPVARMRARGQLVEIGADQLGLTDGETAALLNGLNGLSLDDRSVSLLRGRTEGWAAGLYLAALTLKDRDDPQAFVDAFAGNDRHVVDYLSAEVIDALAPDVREFLGRTAHLDRLNADLCDAVTETTGSGHLLRALESSNAFLVPLDNRREWYRYHHLFAELLRHQLAPHSAAELGRLHRRAGAWFRRHGFVSDAIRHAIAAGDHQDATELISSYWIRARDRGLLETILLWIDSLPEETVRADAHLCLVRAATLQEVGRFEAADIWLESLDAHLARDAPPRADGRSLAAGAAACHSINRYFAGNASGILALADDAEDAGDETQWEYWRSALLTTKGVALFVVGRTDEAILSLRHAVALGKASGHQLALIHALGWLVVAQEERGLRSESLTTLDTIEAVFDLHPGLASYYGSAMAHVARAVVRIDTLPDEAESQARRGIELAGRGAARFEEAYALVLLARILTAQRRVDDASAAARAALDVVRLCPDPGRLADLAAEVSPGITHPTAARTGTLPFGEVLTEREFAVLRLLVTRLSQREIGGHLHLSFNTVKTHVKNIFRKLGVATRQEAVQRARDLGLL